MSGMDMGNQVPSVEGQMVGEGENDYMPTGHWDTPKEQSTPYPRQCEDAAACTHYATTNGSFFFFC